MKAPLKSMTVTGPFYEVAVPGTGLPDAKGVRRHIGVDLRASIGTPVYAPGDGVVTFVDNVGLKYVELKISDKLHRFLHLSKNILKVGQSVKQGQVIGYSGDSGGVAAHLHWDVRKNGTSWSSSLSNYENPLNLISKGDEMITKHSLEFIFLELLGRAPDAGAVSHYVGHYTTDFVIDDVKNSDEFKKKQQIRTAQAKAEAAKLTDRDRIIKNQQSEITKLRAEVAAGGTGEDSIQLNALGAALRWLVQRLGLK